MYKKITLAAALLFCTMSGSAQQKNHWNEVNAQRASASGNVKKLFEKSEGKYYTLNHAELKAQLAAAPQRFSGNQGITIGFPDAQGTTEYFTVYEYSNFSPDLQEQFPDIRAYAGFGIENPASSLRFSFSPKGLQAMITRPDSDTEFIEPYTAGTETYILFTEATKSRASQPFTCFTGNGNAQHSNLKSGNVSARSSSLTFKTFRLALSCTAEYTQYHGGTKQDALAAMNATMTRVNGVYERDLAVKLEIIPNVLNIIYTNPNSDPYSDFEEGSGWFSYWNSELQSNLNNTIGNGNYDIGHLLGHDGGGGNAGCIGCVCSSGKGSGYTSPLDGIPEGDSFDIDYVSHEMGHQLGAFHTYSVDNEQSGVNVEPGSGSTIMGYAGITGGTTDVQQHSDDYFAYRSIQQIQDNLASKSCAVNTTLTNTAMVINAGSNYTIPKGTAFILKAVGADANAAAVTYNWEQNDNVTNNTSGGSSVVYPAKPAGPTFRSVLPSASPDRYMPKLATVLNNSLTANWETVSTVGRDLNFTLTGRDNIAGGGQTKTDAMKVTVNATAGPFIVTSQNTQGITWPIGSVQNIEWDVAGTTANGINTENVNIWLSIDGGQTFTTPLALNTPNDGAESVTVPNVALVQSECRIMVAAADNIYYALNRNAFSITDTADVDTNSSADFVLYPNPNNGSFTVQLPQVTGKNVTVTVHDVRGRQVFSNSYAVTGSLNQTISLTGAEAGIYLVSVHDGVAKTTKKIVIR